MKECAVIIPALEPPHGLIDYVKTLIDEKIAQVIVINDGSGPEFNPIFEHLREIDRVTVLVHPENRGKGAALKTGMTYYLERINHLRGVITADADGQHAIEDILKIARQLKTSDVDFILGMRDFSLSSVPLRSYVGNIISAHVFNLVYGYYFKDTQTGLRGIATDQLTDIVHLSGDAFEYETNMLIHIAKHHKSVTRLDIRTIYAENHTSHYSTVKDSMKILKLVIKSLMFPSENKS